MLLKTCHGAAQTPNRLENGISNEYWLFVSVAWHCNHKRRVSLVAFRGNWEIFMLNRRFLGVGRDLCEFCHRF